MVRMKKYIYCLDRKDIFGEQDPCTFIVDPTNCKLVEFEYFWTANGIPFDSAIALVKLQQLLLKKRKRKWN